MSMFSSKSDGCGDCSVGAGGGGGGGGAAGVFRSWKVGDDVAASVVSNVIVTGWDGEGAV